MRLFALVLLFGACGASSPSDFDRACDESATGDCILFSGEDWLPAEVSEDCEGDVVASCPSGALGRCVIDEGGRFETESYFYPGFWTGQGAAEACARVPNSSWTAL